MIIPIRSSRHLVETYIQIYDAQRQAAAYVALDTPALARQIRLKDSLGTLPIVSATGSQQANRYRVGWIQLGSEKLQI